MLQMNVFVHIETGLKVRGFSKCRDRLWQWWRTQKKSQWQVLFILILNFDVLKHVLEHVLLDLLVS